MSAVNVTVAIDIAASPADVASLMFDPARTPDWMAAVKSVELLSTSLEPGARVRHQGQFVGRDIAWTTEVQAVHFPHVLVLKVADGPFVGTITYEVQRGGAGSVARIHNEGQTTVMSFLPSSVVEGPMRSALTEDLRRLKALVEAPKTAPR